MGWQAYTPARGGLRHWLQASGSLSARLAARGEAFGVQVLAQGRQPLTPDESRALGLGGRRMGYAREVVLRVDGQALVFGRSVTAHAASVGAWRSVRGLGGRPLANVLFRRLDILRAPLAFNRLQRKPLAAPRGPFLAGCDGCGPRSPGLAGAPFGLYPPWRSAAGDGSVCRPCQLLALAAGQPSETF
jgi:hypothetical protein